MSETTQGMTPSNEVRDSAYHAFMATQHPALTPAMRATDRRTWDVAWAAAFALSEWQRDESHYEPLEGTHAASSPSASEPDRTEPVAPIPAERMAPCFDPLCTIACGQHQLAAHDLNWAQAQDDLRQAREERDYWQTWQSARHKLQIEYAQNAWQQYRTKYEQATAAIRRLIRAGANGSMEFDAEARRIERDILHGSAWDDVLRAVKMRPADA